MKKNILKILFPVMAILTISGGALAQDEVVVNNEMQQRIEFKASFKPIKNLKLSLNPELRFDESFSLDKYHIEGMAEYKVLDFMSVSAAYRFIVNPRDGKTTEYFNRYALGLEFQHKIERFKPNLLIRYTNYADDEISDKQFIRYKASVDYNIRKCKITPFAEAEAFQDLTTNSLYKMRYALGADYKIMKNNYVGVAYKLDYYLQEYTNKHIFNVSYKIKF
ncbi:MAG: hypothetical protein C0593_09880 [Marinilabiliales bacterium]|nr:MAG: hypothetical protein C0593_09880 [Marinilabiliales bacterium]